MIKRVSILLVGLFLALFVVQTFMHIGPIRVQGRDWNIHLQVNAAGVPTSLTFTYDYTLVSPLSGPPCPAVLPLPFVTPCISGFTFTVAVNGTVTTTTTISNPTTTSTTGPTTISVPLPALTGMGNYNWCILPNYKSPGPVTLLTGQGGSSCYSQTYPVAATMVGVQ